MQPVTITLNQRVVSGHSDMTILDIARESGVHIPTLCHDPHLKPVGACRICLVENEESGALLASCVTPLAPGLTINTHSEKVLEHRRNIVKLLLASHPDACPVCDKGNRCALRQIATELGVGEVGLERIPQYAEVKELNPFISRDGGKCILCGKCIRACQELVVEGALDYYQRGFATRPATFQDKPLEHSECTFCGTCVAMCPTGALTEREKPYQGTTGTSVLTTCSFCGSGCPLSLEIKDGYAVRALPAWEGIPGQGSLCVRGSFGFDYIHSCQRLTRPWIRENGSFREATWQEALARAGSGLIRSREEHGPEAVAAYGSPRCTNEENYLLQRLARTALQTNNVDNSSSLFQSIIREGLGSTTGFLTTSSFWDTLQQTEVILVLGTDPTAAAPQVGYAIKRAVRQGQAQLILVDPVRTKLSLFAQQWLRSEPGTQLLLLNSLAQTVVEEGLLDQEYVGRQTEGFAALSEALTGFSAERVGEAANVAPEDIRAAARLFAQAEKALIVFGPGVEGAESVRALANLALLTGNGYNIYPLQEGSNAQGACEMGALPEFLPGYQPVQDKEARQRLETLWQESLPSWPGTSAAEAFSRGRGIPWKALYIMGENPVASLAEPQRVQEALSGLGFLVVQDLFFTETARYADVILPACSFAEKEGSFTNLQGGIGWLRRALPTLGESLPDWEIILLLAREMGKSLPYSNLQQVINDIDDFVPLYEGYSQFEHFSGGTALYWEERRNRAFQSLSGFPSFSPPQSEARAGERPQEYPFHLFLEESLVPYGSGTRSDHSRRLVSMYPAQQLRINSKDADWLFAKSGDQLRIISAAGQLKAVAVVSEAVPAGTVSLPPSLPGVLELFTLGREGVGGRPSLRSAYVKLEKEVSHE